MLISFEGIDGCGKSTQIEKLKTHLDHSGRPVCVFREPGGTFLSEKIRSLLLDEKVEIHPLAEMLLFSAARAQLVFQRIRPLLEKGTTVILDRFFDSTTAYQGYGREAAATDAIQQLNALATGRLIPDITFYLQIKADEAFRRRQTGKGPDRIENAGDDFFRRVSDGFDMLAKKEARFVVLDASESPEKIFKNLLIHLERRFPAF